MLRLSLREMLVLVALVAVAIASLKYASQTWLAIVAAVAMASLFVSLITAAMDRGERQAFAAGFAITIAAYALVLLTGLSTSPGWNNSTMLKNIEFDPGDGRLPTTRLLRYVHRVFDASIWLDAQGQPIPNYEPSSSGGMGGGMGGFGGPQFLEIPPREFFMPIGHIWWMLVFAYAGGHFARFVYRRRCREEQKLPAETS